MIRFGYDRPSDVAEAVRDGNRAGVRFLAGGSNLVDLMKENVERPVRVVDINRLPLKTIEAHDGGLRIGALVTNTDCAWDARVEARYPILSSAILAGASAQLRNVATMGGNLNQRTRCLYFYDTATACNKRDPGTGCTAIGGVNRINAVLGASPACIATHPSDMAVGLAVLDAVVNVTGPLGDRAIPFAEYHRLPGDDPTRDNTLKPGELVTSVDLPDEDFSGHHTYLKLRDRLSYAFALVSVAVVMRIDGGRIAEARIALGGVAHKPWRVRSAETLLIGEVPSQSAFLAAAHALLNGAQGQGGNDFKIGLARRAIVRACRQASAGTPQSQVDKRIA